MKPAVVVGGREEKSQLHVVRFVGTVRELEGCKRGQATYGRSGLECS